MTDYFCSGRDIDEVNRQRLRRAVTELALLGRKVYGRPCEEYIQDLQHRVQDIFNQPWVANMLRKDIDWEAISQSVTLEAKSEQAIKEYPVRKQQISDRLKTYKVKELKKLVGSRCPELCQAVYRYSKRGLVELLAIDYAQDQDQDGLNKLEADISMHLLTPPAAPGGGK